MSSSPQRKRLPPEERRQLLLEAAARTFGRLGYEGTRMEDIAKDAGVAKGLLYRHFSSKDELFSALMQERGEDFSRRLMESFLELGGGEADPWRLVEQGLSLWLQQVADDIASSRWVFDLQFHDACEPFRRQVTQAVVDQMRALAPDFDPDLAWLVATAFSGANEAFGREMAELHGRVDQRAAHQLMLAFLLRGLDGVREYMAMDLPPVPPVQPRRRKRVSRKR